MQLTQEDLEEFKAIYRQEFGTVLTDAEALEVAQAAITLVKTVYCQPLRGPVWCLRGTRDNLQPCPIPHRHRRTRKLAPPDSPLLLVTGVSSLLCAVSSPRFDFNVAARVCVPWRSCAIFTYQSHATKAKPRIQRTAPCASSA